MAKDISFNQICPLVPNELFKIINNEITSLLYKVATENNLDFNYLIKKHSNDISKIGVKFGVKKRNRRVLPCDKQCMGRKLDGLQCTRGRNENSEFCKSHANKLPYGRIDEEYNKSSSRRKKKNGDDFIVTRIVNINGDNFLVDTNNFVFSFSVTNPIFLGILVVNDGVKKIEKIENLNL